MEKVAREAKARTSWTAPQAPYEAALQGFVEADRFSGNHVHEGSTLDPREDDLIEFLGVLRF